MSKGRKIFDALGEADGQMVREAAETRLRRPHRTVYRVAAAAACLALALGIFAAVKNGGASGVMGALAEVALPQAYAFDDYESRRAVWEQNPLDEAFYEQVREFSYRTASAALMAQDGNSNYSPLSLYYALTTAALAARGETQAELLDLLGATDADTLTENCGRLYRRLYKVNDIGALRLATSLWMDDDVEFREQFVREAAERLYAYSFRESLSDPDTAEKMADWVSEMTGGLIEPDMELGGEQIMAILNTIYFRDEWINRFSEDSTAEDTFYLAVGGEVRCDFMNATYGSAGFQWGENFVRAQLGMKNRGSMVFVLPDEGTDVRELLASPEALREAFEGGEQSWGEVVWQIPKFDFGAETDAGEVLRTLGVERMFGYDADFSGAVDGVAYISGVGQQTRISIDERGVEAAAFTRIDYAGAAPPNGRAEMILNRPFLYGITAENGTLLFVGVCADPTAK